jgi:hypothetical protein
MEGSHSSAFAGRPARKGPTAGGRIIAIRTRIRLGRLILPIPCWEGRGADPEEKQEPATSTRRIGRVSSSRVDYGLRLDPGWEPDVIKCASFSACWDPYRAGHLGRPGLRDIRPGAALERALVAIGCRYAFRMSSPHRRAGEDQQAPPGWCDRRYHAASFPLEAPTFCCRECIQSAACWALLAAAKMAFGSFFSTSSQEAMQVA